MRDLEIKFSKITQFFKIIFADQNENTSKFAMLKLNLTAWHCFSTTQKIYNKKIKLDI